MVSLACHLDDSETFIQKALQWAAQFDHVCYLDSNGYRDNHGNINVFIAVGATASFASEGENTFASLRQFLDRYPNTWVPGYLGYDLKNELEDLDSQHPNRTGVPNACFFVPDYTLLIGQFNAEIKGRDPQRIVDQIHATRTVEESPGFEGRLKYRMNKSAYFTAFADLQRHICQGDVYEVNLCQEFYAEQANLNPLAAYRRLNEVSPTPFSCFFKFGHHYILSASPERFLSKNGNTLLSQPSKGTTPRGKDAIEDEQIKATLATSPKEISENIMIVDLVRNDLTQSAAPGTVRAEQLLQIHSFKQVHQLVSTVTCEIRPGVDAVETLQNTFPPGSMTGAPKISAMKLIDRYENSRRGVYSGALGYFSPQGNYDFSV